MESDDYFSQCLLEVAAYLSISAGRRVSVAMMVDKLCEEIKSDDSYKYVRQAIVGTVNITKFEGKLLVYIYHKDSLTVSPEGLIMFKGSIFLVPETLRPGLLKALHTGHKGVVSMITRAKEAFWWPGLKPDIENVRANCLVCHENAPYQPKQPSMGVLKTKYAYKALSMDHFFLKGVEFLVIGDRHSGMLSVHCTAHRGAKELFRILRVHCQHSGIPRIVYTDGSSIFCAQEKKDFFKRFDIEHVVSIVSNPHLNLRSEVSVKHLKRMLQDIVGNSGNLDSDAVTEALLCHANTKYRILNKLPAELAYGRCLKDFFSRSVSSLVPIPANLMSGEVKDKLQEKNRSEGDRRWSKHTPILPE